jgi:hypothetical protein
MRDLIAELNRTLEGRYRVSGVLGRGGMAVVHRARDLRHDRDVAIKVLLPELAAVTGVSRFAREIEIEAGLRHPHILPLLDSGEVEGLPFYVMPLVEGETLSDRLKRESQLPVDEVVRLGIEVADALAYAHARGLIHRDIKPSNILLESGHSVVTDFGIARALHGPEDGRLTSSGATLGSPLYMSPEQAGGSGDLDARTDVYSLGCVLYEALTGDPPFLARLPQAILARKLVEPAPSPRLVRPTVSSDLDEVIRRALAPQPGDRFRDAAALRGALRSIPTGVAGAGADVARRAEPGRSPARWWRIGLGAVGAVVPLAGIGYLTNRVHDLRLGIPPEYRPTRSDYLVLGGQTLFPLLIFALVALAGWVAFHSALRFAAWLLRRSPRLADGLDATQEALRRSWSGAWGRLSPQTVSDLFLLGAVAGGLVILAPYQGLILGETSDLGSPGLRRSFPIVLTVWVGILAVGWQTVFRRLGPRARSGRVSLSRWASLAWIVVMLVITTLPWRLLWDSDAERVRVDGRRGYLMLETSAEALVYEPGAGTTVAIPSGGGHVEHSGTTGYVFEDADAFEAALEGR